METQGTHFVLDTHELVKHWFWGTVGLGGGVALGEDYELVADPAPPSAPRRSGGVVEGLQRVYEGRTENSDAASEPNKALSSLFQVGSTRQSVP